MTAETMTGMVKITRSINLGSKDNNLHIGAELPVMIQPGWTPDQISAMYTDGFYQIKAVVYEQAGIEFSVDEGGILREVIGHHLPGTTEERAPARSSGGGGGERAARQARGFPDPRDLERPPHIDEVLWDDLCDNPGDWYDNRGDKASGSKAASWPDFKSKQDGTGIWLAPFRRGNGGGGGQRSGRR
jgi:hypothetical protein